MKSSLNDVVRSEGLKIRGIGDSFFKGGSSNYIVMKNYKDNCTDKWITISQGMCIVYINGFIYDFMLTYHAVYGCDNTNWFYICLQVQSELKRKWRSLRLKRYIGRDYRLHSSSISKNGTENMAQFHRNSRAQSFLQTETTVVWDIPRTEATLYESCSYFTAPQLTTRFFPPKLYAEEDEAFWSMRLTCRRHDEDSASLSRCVVSTMQNLACPPK